MEITVLCTIALVVTIGAFVLIVLTIHNTKRADKLSKLNAQKEALTMLSHAMEYLTKEGIGHNLEWSYARSILESAMYNVLYT